MLVVASAACLSCEVLLHWGLPCFECELRSALTNAELGIRNAEPKGVPLAEMPMTPSIGKRTQKNPSFAILALPVCVCLQADLERTHVSGRERRFSSRVGPGNARKTCACVACAACLPRFACKLWKALVNAERGMRNEKPFSRQVRKGRQSKHQSGKEPRRMLSLRSWPCLCVFACRQTLSERMRAGERQAFPHAWPKELGMRSAERGNRNAEPKGVPLAETPKSANVRRSDECKPAMSTQ